MKRFAFIFIILILVIGILVYFSFKDNNKTEGANYNTTKESEQNIINEINN